MRPIVIMMLVSLSIANPQPVPASDLAFPATEAAIVKALSGQAQRAEINGTVYEYKDQKLYRVINGKRYRMRGIVVMEASALLPRAGPLVRFDLDSARIKPASYPLLDEFGKALEGQLHNAVVLIAGHADRIGPAAYNQHLSEKRSQAVIDYLVKHHRVAPQRMIARGYGETRPLRTDDSEEGRAQNRRVEFIRIE